MKYAIFYLFSKDIWQVILVFYVYTMLTFMCADLGIDLSLINRYWVFITDTDYLYVYVADNRYAEPIFIYCYKEWSPFFTFSRLNNNKLLKIKIFM